MHRRIYCTVDYTFSSSTDVYQTCALKLWQGTKIWNNNNIFQDIENFQDVEFQDMGIILYMEEKNHTLHHTTIARRKKIYVVGHINCIHAHFINIRYYQTKWLIMSCIVLLLNSPSTRCRLGYHGVWIIAPTFLQRF